MVDFWSGIRDLNPESHEPESCALPIRPIPEAEFIYSTFFFDRIQIMEGYKNLSSYILATVLCDLNIKFLRSFINPKSRTWDQMEQASRSGKQNIAEGYSMQSLEGYIKLAGVALGSFKELAADFEDFLRQRDLVIWDKNDRRIRVFREFRAIWNSPNIPNTPNLPKDPEEAANMLLTFCQMETFLLSRQTKALTEKFVKEGGFRENLFKKRLEQKRKT